MAGTAESPGMTGTLAIISLACVADSPLHRCQCTNRANLFKPGLRDHSSHRETGDLRRRPTGGIRHPARISSVE